MTQPESLAYVEAKIAALVTKLDKARNEESKFYYRACLRGWQTTLDKLRAKGGGGVT